MKQSLFLSLAISLLSSTQITQATEDIVINKDTIKTFNIDEIVVTSSTKETNDLKLLPGSVSILSPQSINARQIEALKDISVYVPNLYMPDYG